VAVIAIARPVPPPEPDAPEHKSDRIEDIDELLAQTREIPVLVLSAATASRT